MTKLQRELIVKKAKLQELVDFIKSADVSKDAEAIAEKDKEADSVKAQIKAIETEIGAEEAVAPVEETETTAEKVVEKSQKQSDVKFDEIVVEKTANGLEMTKEVKDFFDYAKAAILTTTPAESSTKFGEKGVIVPVTIRRTIIEAAENYSKILDLTTRVSGFEIEEEIGASDWTFSPVDEGSAVSDSTTGTTKFTLKSHLYGLSMSISKRMLHNTTAEFANYLIGRIARAYAKTLEQEIFLGTGDSNKRMTGILSTSGIKSTTLSTRDTLTKAEIDAFLLQLNDSDDDNATLVMHKTVWSKVINMQVSKDDQRSVWSDRSLSTTRGALLLKGYPVRLSSHMPAWGASGAKELMILGDWKEYITNVNRDFTMEVSDHAEIKKNQRVYASFVELGGGVRRKEAFHVLKNKA